MLAQTVTLMKSIVLTAQVKKKTLVGYDGATCVQDAEVFGVAQEDGEIGDRIDVAVKGEIECLLWGSTDSNVSVGVLLRCGADGMAALALRSDITTKHVFAHLREKEDPIDTDSDWGPALVLMD
uniref:Uncharacterized protein n=1 Tax=Candidatus Kentrum sp. UNK TaxID=2126344 RepID=A0A451AQH5_9GAMM|nr:MAG: hypothetical protein BECKUNK1418G_GA0071005_100245 [Candidatus Kentron sp. UNK]VFK68311.1 MAG: hypothetical protein BECKUNK1418H_GA0071006_100145 [Candidatus Kentron sp. UNK]